MTNPAHTKEQIAAAADCEKTFLRLMKKAGKPVRK